jgi:hypothetical protein
MNGGLITLVKFKQKGCDRPIWINPQAVVSLIEGVADPEPCTIIFCNDGTPEGCSYHVRGSLGAAVQALSGRWG